jgi:hypothetical protein
MEDTETVYRTSVGKCLGKHSRRRLTRTKSSFVEKSVFYS